MREDMAKVIVERPRLGGGMKFPRPQRHGRDGALDEGRRYQGMRRPWGTLRKGLNENLAPLRRYLRSNVGRPWDKVYGEICQRINRSSAVQLHIWQHLVQYVCTDPYVVSGKVSRGWFRGFEFFVHPRTGLLCEKPWRRYRRPPPDAPIDRVPVDGAHEYGRIDGIWYALELAPLPTATWASVYDVVFRKNVPASNFKELESLYGRRAYATRKRQLGKREIRRLPVSLKDAGRAQ